MPDPAAPPAVTPAPAPAVAPTPPAIPTVVVHLAGRGPVSVVFDLDRLSAIEDATGMSVFEILSKFSDIAPKTEEGQEKPSHRAILESLFRTRLKLVNTFAAGCLGLRPEQLTQEVGLRNVQRVSQELQNGFMTAVLELVGAQDDSAGKPSAQPATSGPGPVSS